MLRVGSCFSGVGFWEMGLKQLGIDHKQMFCVEHDKYPYASYKAIHGDIKNYGDVTSIKGHEVEDIDLFVYSPPCQAFSVAGKQQGVDDHRGVLFFDALRIIQAKQPKVCVMENVKGLTNKKFSETFKSMLTCLTMAGYTNYWKVLNTKDFGIPQNRERVFIVSIRNDIDNGFEWPVPFDNGLRLKHMLEDQVDEKFYLKNNNLEWWNKNYEFQCRKKYSSLDAEVAICQTNRQYASWNGNYVTVPEATKKGYAIATEGDSINLDQPNSKTRRGRVGVGVAQTLTTGCNQAVVEPNELIHIGNIDMKGNDQIKRVYDADGLCPTLSTMQGGHREHKTVDNLRIRKLTAKECWRLQGATDEDFEKAAQVNSNSQLYKQAGNGVSVNVVKQIYIQLQEKGYI